MPNKSSPKSSSHLQILKPYILVFSCLIIGISSIALLILTVAAAFIAPMLAIFPFSAFVLTLRMSYGLARLLISGA